MTGGGPQRATLFYAMYIFQSAFEDLRMGYASAQAVILFLIILACTYLATRVMRKHVHYGGV
jgi:multiple sugar transport system permease protein